MLRIKTFFLAAILAVTSAIVFAQTSSAQSVVVIDNGKILRESLAGQSLAARLETIRTQIEQELQPTATQLQSEAQTLNARVANKTQEMIRADAALTAQINAHQRKTAEFAQRSNRSSQEMQLTERNALIRFNEALQPVLQEVVNERSAQVMLAKSQVVYASDAVDVTQTVIAKLNSRTTSITVTRERMPTQTTTTTP